MRTHPKGLPGVGGTSAGDVLSVDGSGVVSWTTPAASPDALITTRGDLIYGDATAAAARLAVGTAGQVLGTDGTDVSWVAGVDSILTTRGDLIREGASGAERVPLGADNTVLASDGTDAAWEGLPSLLAATMTTRGDLLYVDSGGSVTRLPVGTASQVLTSDGTDAAWADAAGGGGAYDTTDSATYEGIAATTTNYDLLVAPNGTGAIRARTGGNARGDYAVDLQGSASAATMVASGNYSLLAGINGTASGYASVALGGNPAASGSSSFAAGNSTISSASYTFCTGNQNDATATGAAAFYRGNALAEGAFCLGLGAANERYSTGMGLYVDANVYASFVMASGKFSANGDSQVERIHLMNTTTDATVTDLLPNPGSLNYMEALPSGTAVTFSVLIIGRESSTNDAYGAHVTGLLQNAGGTTQIVGTVTRSEWASAGAAAWDGTVVADNTNDRLAVQVTGEAAHTIQWSASVTFARVGG